ncbi:MAG: glycosyltransferase [Verrucomicrobiota bacterium]
MATNEHPIQRVALSYHPTEWWFDHLASGFAKNNVTVERFAAPFRKAPGFSWDVSLQERLAEYRDDSALYLGSPTVLYGDLVKLACPTAIWHDYFSEETDAEYLPMAQLFDLVFLTSKDGLNRMISKGCDNVFWLPHGFDDTLEYNQNLARIYQVGFVGATNLPSHEKRRRLLPMLAAKYRMNEYQTPVFGNEMYRVYNQSKIVVNIPNLSSFNMRNFEAMAAGALLLTEPVGHGMSELFQEDRHYAVYSSPEELVSKIDYFLAHDQERETIARSGQAEVVARHSYRHRAAEVLSRASQIQGRRWRSQNPDHLAKCYAVFYHRQQRLDLLLRLLKKPGLGAGARWFVLLRCLRGVLAALKQPAPC